MGFVYRLMGELFKVLLNEFKETRVIGRAFSDLADSPQAEKRQCLEERVKQIWGLATSQGAKASEASTKSFTAEIYCKCFSA